MKKRRLLSFVISIITLLCITFSLFSVLVSAEPDFSNAEYRFYEIINTLDEPHYVSRVFTDCGPAVFYVLDKTYKSLTYQEKVLLVLYYASFWGEYSTDFLVETNFPMSIFKNYYYMMFGEDFIPEIGFHFLGETYLNEQTEIWINNEDNVTFLRIPMILPEYTGSGTLWSTMCYIKDYQLFDKELYITVGVRVSPLETDEKIPGLTNAYKSYFNSTAYHDQTYEHEDFWGAHWDRDFFQDSVDHTIWEEYSEYFTLYTMKYEKDSDGYWHWKSCYLKNPSTDDTVDLFYPLLFLVSATGMTVLILKRRLATAQR